MDSQYQQIYTLNQGDLSCDYQYTFLEDTDEDPFFVCFDQNGKYSIALENKSRGGKYLYYLLVDLNHFYETIIPEKLEESNWIVFYDQESGLLLQNHDNQDPWMVLSEQEIEDRHDGYSIILNAQGQALRIDIVTWQRPGTVPTDRHSDKLQKVQRPGTTPGVALFV